MANHEDSPSSPHNDSPEPLNSNCHTSSADPAGSPTAKTRIPAIALAARFLFHFDDQKSDDQPAWRTAAHWFIFWGVMIGLFYALAFRGGWRLFGEYNRLRLVPMVLILAIDLVWCGNRLLIGAVHLTSNRRAEGRNPSEPINTQAILLLVLVILLKYALLLSLPYGARRQPLDWREQLGIFYPDVLYRPLILMPIWGRWAMTMALVIGRIAPASSNRLQQMASGMTLSRLMLQWLGCSTLTVMYCCGAGEHLARGVFIVVGVMLAAYLVSFVLARRAGGQTEATVCATGLAGELAFLLVYLPVATNIYGW